MSEYSNIMTLYSNQNHDTKPIITSYHGFVILNIMTIKRGAKIYRVNILSKQ